MPHKTVALLLCSMLCAAGLGSTVSAHSSSKVQQPRRATATVAQSAQTDRSPTVDSNLSPGNDRSVFSEAEADGYLPPKVRASDNSTDSPRAVGQDDSFAVPRRSNLAPVLSTAYPWSTIGRLEQLTPDGKIAHNCTGTLVGRDLVLTNAHCVVDKKTKRLVRRVLRFRPNVINGQARAVAYARRVRYGQFNDDGYSANDWALVKLDRLLGDDFGTLGWRSLPAPELRKLGKTLRLVGYSRDFPKDIPGKTAATYQGCQVLGGSQGILYHDCNSNQGASSGPILAQINGKYRIVALHSGNLGSKNYAISVSRWSKLALEMQY